MARAENIESDVFYDCTTDTYNVRIRRIMETDNGEVFKEGAMFRIREEDFWRVCKGGEYPINIKTDLQPTGKEIVKEGKNTPENRWEVIMEEADVNSS